MQYLRSLLSLLSHFPFAFLMYLLWHVNKLQHVSDLMVLRLIWAHIIIEGKLIFVGEII